MASGGSAARAGPARNDESKDNVTIRMSMPRLLSSFRGDAKQRTRNPSCRRACGRMDSRLASSRGPGMTEVCLRHRPGEVFRDLVEEARGREPALVGADQQRKILGH